MTEIRNLRVVVADDEEINLYVLMKNMNDNGYNAKGFGGGMPVWEYLQQNPYQADIVILDKMMNDLNGVEIIKLMKSHPVLKNVPIMLQSGCVDSREALEAGADCYLVKPFTSKAILAAVEELASVKSLLQ